MLQYSSEESMAGHFVSCESPNHILSEYTSEWQVWSVDTFYTEGFLTVYVEILLCPINLESVSFCNNVNTVEVFKPNRKEKL